MRDTNLNKALQDLSNDFEKKEELIGLILNTSRRLDSILYKLYGILRNIIKENKSIAEEKETLCKQKNMFLNMFLSLQSDIHQLNAEQSFRGLHLKIWVYESLLIVIRDYLNSEKYYYDKRERETLLHNLARVDSCKISNLNTVTILEQEKYLKIIQSFKSTMDFYFTEYKSMNNIKLQEEMLDKIAYAIGQAQKAIRSLDRVIKEQNAQLIRIFNTTFDYSTIKLEDKRKELKKKKLLSNDSGEKDLISQFVARYNQIVTLLEKNMQLCLGCYNLVSMNYHSQDSGIKSIRKDFDDNIRMLNLNCDTVKYLLRDIKGLIKDTSDEYIKEQFSLYSILNEEFEYLKNKYILFLKTLVSLVKKRNFVNDKDNIDSTFQVSIASPTNLLIGKITERRKSLKELLKSASSF